MRAANEKLAADLLDAGKREFLAVGFQRASLRTISASLGVTTGSIYRYYTDKEALFDALVEKPALEFEARYRAVHHSFAELPLDQQLTDLPEVSGEGHAWMVQYVYDHYDAFKLIACCAAGTKYEHYIETLTEIEANSSRVLLDRMAAAGYHLSPIDDDLLHIISGIIFNGLFEAVRHDMPWEKATVYLNTLRDFYAAGWFKILGISNP